MPDVSDRNLKKSHLLATDDQYLDFSTSLRSKSHDFYPHTSPFTECLAWSSSRGSACLVIISYHDVEMFFFSYFCWKNGESVAVNATDVHHAMAYV